MTVQSLTLTRPDDCHLHLRDGAALASVLPHTVRAFARAVVMPNLKPPVTSTTLAAEIALASRSGFVCGIKYYPAGATTNSEAGVTRMDRVYPALAAMEEHGLPLLVHGEVASPDVDPFDRERVFIETILADVMR